MGEAKAGGKIFIRGRSEAAEIKQKGDLFRKIGKGRAQYREKEQARLAEKKRAGLVDCPVRLSRKS